MPDSFCILFRNTANPIQQALLVRSVAKSETANKVSGTWVRTTAPSTVNISHLRPGVKPAPVPFPSILPFRTTYPPKSPLTTLWGTLSLTYPQLNSLNLPRLTPHALILSLSPHATLNSPPTTSVRQLAASHGRRSFLERDLNRTWSGHRDPAAGSIPLSYHGRWKKSRSQERSNRRRTLKKKACWRKSIRCVGSAWPLQVTWFSHRFRKRPARTNPEKSPNTHTWPLSVLIGALVQLHTSTGFARSTRFISSVFVVCVNRWYFYFHIFQNKRMEGKSEGLKGSQHLSYGSHIYCSCISISNTTAMICTWTRRVTHQIYLDITVDEGQTSIYIYFTKSYESI